MFLWNTSLSSSQSARFLNKVNISCTRKLTFDLLPVLWYDLELIKPLTQKSKERSQKTSRHKDTQRWKKQETDEFSNQVASAIMAKQILPTYEISRDLV